MQKQLTPHLTDLSEILKVSGVEVLRVTDREITGRCPVHERVTGHADNSPSWSMNASTGLWLCFSCGARGTLSMLLSELSGEEGISAQQFLINAGMQRLTNAATSTYQVPQKLDTEAFFKFERVSDKHCFAKNLDPDIIYRYGVRWNPANKSWCIPIISSMGSLMGWQEKRPGWVRNFPIGIEKSKTLFGVERFRSRTSVLVESPLDVVRLETVGITGAVATFGAIVSEAQLKLIRSSESVVAAFDNPNTDDAGRKACESLIVSARKYGIEVKFFNYNGLPAKDPGEMTAEDIHFGLDNAKDMIYGEGAYFVKSN